MVRSDLIHALQCANPELRPDEVRRIVDLFFDELARHLSQGGRIELRGFGSFHISQREAKKAHNPRTGQLVEKPAYQTPRFRAAKTILARIQPANDVVRVPQRHNEGGSS